LPAKEEAASPMDDPQFKSALGVALTQCILPELQKGSTATNDEARSTDLLIGRCQRPWIAWVNECINHGETEDSCIRKSTALARSAIKQFTQ